MFGGNERAMNISKYWLTQGIIITMAVILFGCFPKKGNEIKCRSFINSREFITFLSLEEIDSAIDRMDMYVINKIGRKVLMGGLRELSDNIRSDFGTTPQISLITTEKTIHEGFEASFLICKLASRTDFGYYFFYLNSITDKILLVSKFSSIKKRA